MAEQTEQAARTDVSLLRSWIIRHPIATFLVLVCATTTALAFVPRALTEPGCSRAERHRTGTGECPRVGCASICRYRLGER
jgi:hypothetical protein